MARRTFPSEGSRLAYGISGPYLAHRVSSTVALYADEGLTTLADVRVKNADGSVGSAYSGSAVPVDSASQFPDFYGPDDDSDVLYYDEGGTVGVIRSNEDDRLDALEAAGTDHLGDASDAHDASAISFAPTGGIAATNVQAAVVEAVADAAASAAAAYVVKDHLAVDVRDHGATGNGSADDTAAIQAAIDLVDAAGGGDVLFPDANSGFAFRINGQLDLENTQNVTLRGYSSGRSESGLARLYFYGSSVGLRCGSARGLTLSGLVIRKLNAAYAGVLVDLSALTAGGDTGAVTVESCFFGSSAPGDLNGDMVRLNRVQQVAFRDCVFRYGARAIVRDPTLAGVAGEANAVTLDNCLFDRQGTAQIDSPGSAWVIRGCAFEPLSSGALGGIVTNAGTLVAQTKGLVIEGCWFADALTSATGSWVQLRGADGVTITGTYFQSGGGTGLRLDGVESGLTITGNYFQGYSSGTPAGTGINFGTGPHVGVLYAGNVFRHLTTDVTGAVPRDATHPAAFKRARWHPAFYYTVEGARSVLAHNIGRMILVPLDAPIRGGITKVACEITTVGVGSIIRLGVYADDGTGVPATLLAECTGTIDASTGTTKELSLPSTVTVPDSGVWLAGVIQAAACTVRTRGLAPDHRVGATNLANAMGGNGTNCYGYDGVTGALPATLTAGSLISSTHGMLLAAVVS